jgi:CheY-like chemotaxis protein
VVCAVRNSAGAFRRALVVDDEGGLQLLVRAILEQGPFIVDVARDGLEACDRIRQTSYDAIVCDIYMQSMDGAAFYGALKEYDSRQAERVIFVTGGSLDPETRARVRDSGRPLLRKPFEIEELERAVTRVADQGLEPVSNA